MYAVSAVAPPAPHASPTPNHEPRSRIPDGVDGQGPLGLTQAETLKPNPRSTPVPTSLSTSGVVPSNSSACPVRPGTYAGTAGGGKSARKKPLPLASLVSPSRCHRPLAPP